MNSDTPRPRFHDETIAISFPDDTAIMERPQLPPPPVAPRRHRLPSRRALGVGASAAATVVILGGGWAAANAIRQTNADQITFGPPGTATTSTTVGTMPTLAAAPTATQQPTTTRRRAPKTTRRATTTTGVPNPGAQMRAPTVTQTGPTVAAMAVGTAGDR